MLVDAPARGAAGLVGQSFWYVWITLAGIALPLVFPSGRPLSPRWRPVAWLAGAALGLSSSARASGPMSSTPAQVANPLACPAWRETSPTWSLEIGNVLAALAFALAAASLFLRIRRSRGTERAQLKWFALVALLAAACLTVGMLEVLFPGGWRRVAGALGWFGFLFLAIFGIPAATGIAILRHGLYDIDVVIRRTLVYGGADGDASGGLPGLRAARAARDRGRIRARDRRLDARDGGAVPPGAGADPGGSWTAASTAAATTRANTLEQFGARLRDELDLEALGADLRGVVARHDAAGPRVAVAGEAPR